MSPAKRTTPSKRASTRTKKALDREVSLPSESDQIQADAPTLADSYSADAAGDDLEERIRQKAYEIYCSRNGGDGNALEDWLAAERQVRSGSSDVTDRAAGHASSLIESVSEHAQNDAQRDVAG